MTRRSVGEQVAVGLCEVSAPVGMGVPAVFAGRRSSAALYRLLVANLLLQLFDGLATYNGLQLGFGERNPLLRAAFDLYGVGPTLFLSKAFACIILITIGCIARERLATAVFWLIAAVYLACSFVPWLLGLSLWLAGSF